MSTHSILFIENSIGLSGSTMSLCTLLNYLDSDRYEAHIVLSRSEQKSYLFQHLRRPRDLTVITPGRSLKQSAVVQAMLERLGGGQPKLRRLVLQVASLLDLTVVTVPYAWRLYRYAKRRKFNLIHQNNGFDLASVILSRLMRIPLVAYQRGDEWNSPIVRRLARGVQHYIANSATTQASLTSLRIPTRQVSVIYPPLDLDTLQTGRHPAVTRATFGLDASVQCFGIVGMLLPWKGHTVFLQAAKRVFERVPNARALVIGATPPDRHEYEGQLRSLTRDLGIADRVIFTGFRHDVPDILQLLDVVAHASISPEPFGRVIAEAMAMKRPVVATRAGGPAEIIEDGRTGFLVPAGDQDALADRLIRLLENPVLAQRLGEAGCSEVTRRFSGSLHASLVQQVYEEALRSERGQQAAADPLRGELEGATRQRPRTDVRRRS